MQHSPQNSIGTFFLEKLCILRPNLPTRLSGGNSCICEHGKVEGRILGSIIGLQLKKPARKRRKARSGCERWIFGLETRRNIEVNYQTRWRNWAKASSGQSRRSPWGFSRQNWQQRLTCWPTDPIAFGLKSKSYTYSSLFTIKKVSLSFLQSLPGRVMCVTQVDHLRTHYE